MPPVVRIGMYLYQYGVWEEAERASGAKEDLNLEVNRKNRMVSRNAHDFYFRASECLSYIAQCWHFECVT